MFNCSRHRKVHHQYHHHDHYGFWALTVASEGDFSVSIKGGRIMLQLSDSFISVLGVTLQDAGGNPANITGVTVAWSIDNANVGSFVADATNPNNGDFTPGTDLTDIGNITAAVSINGTFAFNITAQVQVVSGAPVSGTIALVSTLPLPAPVTQATAVKKA